jgi:RNA polymerase sigma factor (sigma-70 family)
MVELTSKLSVMGVLPDDLAGPNHDIDNNGRAQEIDSDDRAKPRSPYALLNQRDEVELGRRIQLAFRVQGDLDVSKVASKEEEAIIRRGRLARDRMVLANLRLIRFAIKNLRRPVRSLDPWDLFQEGSIGLMRAVEKFDPELGLKFSTYAMWWIRQAIFRGLDDGDRPIRLPVHRLDSIRRLRLVTRRLSYELGREPSIREVAAGLNWPLEKALFIQRLTQLECISLDTLLGADNDVTIGDTVISREPGPFEIARESQRSDLMRRFIGRLTPRQQLVIERRFGLRNSASPQTLQQLGDHLGITRERVRQIEAIALRRLGKWVNRRMRDELL